MHDDDPNTDRPDAPATTTDPHDDRGGASRAMPRGGVGTCEGVGTDAGGTQGSVPLARALPRLTPPSRPSGQELVDQALARLGVTKGSPGGSAAPTGAAGAAAGSKEVAAGSLASDPEDEAGISPLPALPASKELQTAGEWMASNGAAVLSRAYEVAFCPKGDKTLRKVLVQGLLEIEAAKVTAIGRAAAGAAAGKANAENERLMAAASKVKAMSPGELMAASRRAANSVEVQQA